MEKNETFITAAVNKEHWSIDVISMHGVFTRIVLNACLKEVCSHKFHSLFSQIYLPPHRSTKCNTGATKFHQHPAGTHPYCQFFSPSTKWLGLHGTRYKLTRLHDPDFLSHLSHHSAFCAPLSSHNTPQLPPSPVMHTTPSS